MGWGVDAAESWAAVLQGELRRGDPGVDVLNLGQGGAHPESYVRNARAAIPALLPRLVLVAVLQGDDLMQTVDAMDRGAAPPADLARAERSLADATMGFVRTRLLPNILGAGVRRNVTAAWKETAESMVRNLGPEQRARFERLDEGARASFLRGHLNPIVVQSAILFPDYYARHADPAAPDARRGIGRMAGSLRAIGDVGQRHGAAVAVVSVPYRAYVSRRDGDALRRLGYVIPEGLAESDGPAAAIRQAAGEAGLECFDFTPAFRAACKERDLYYPMDGHFNAAGNAVFAGLLAEAVRAWMTRGAATASQAAR
jgi:hypothetical protein